MAHFPSTILMAAEKELQLTDINPKVRTVFYLFNKIS
jgi:hypothetical protein